MNSLSFEGSQEWERDDRDIVLHSRALEECFLSPWYICYSLEQFWLVRILVPKALKPGQRFSLPIWWKLITYGGKKFVGLFCFVFGSWWCVCAFFYGPVTLSLNLISVHRALQITSWNGGYHSFFEKEIIRLQALKRCLVAQPSLD